ncbi:fibroblast growth factor receptor homolog 1-like isoform X3 [Sitodiplosis mosellana]|uniref:fibroblast growth factor receptor homolog 1-like isoform X3 n=1 Tax=Sitodiplosis mosellana TaxID=263140 RepID=UPI0024446A44|nr:fibroblast growth factor receptor homolog 1-like isoform X3 [Sitodiplosis mosellana]
MNVAIVIVLSSIFNLLSCAKLDRIHTHRTATPMMPTTSMEFISSSTDSHGKGTNDDTKGFGLSQLRNENDGNQIETPHSNMVDRLSNENKENKDSIPSLNESKSGLNPPYFTSPEGMSKFIPKLSGDMAKIPCRAAGTPAPNITWTKDSNQLTRTNGRVQFRKWVIILEDLTPKDTGNYTCKVCNIHGCIEYSTRIEVIDRIYHKPTLPEPPQNNTVLVGSTYIFRCKFVSELFEHVQWIYAVCQNCINNATLLKADDEERQGQLTLHNITHADEGWYTCIVANSLGTTANSAYLHVVDGETLPCPEKLRQNRVRSVAMQPTAAKESPNSSTASNPRLAVVSKNTHNIESSSDRIDSQEQNYDMKIFEGNISTIDTTDSDIDDQIPNENQDDKDSIQTFDESESDLNALPYFTHPEILSKFIPKPSGNMVKIRCAAAGIPAPNITWTKDSNQLMRTNGKVQFRKWAIILEDLTPKDTGHYTCKVCNIHGCIEHSTHVEVIDRFPAKPYIVDGSPANQTVIVNGSVTFSCLVIGDIASHITWAKYHAFNDSDGNWASNPNTVRLEVEDEEKTEELTLHNITHADEGWYTCIAANSLGTTAGSAYLHVVDDFDEKPLKSEHKFSTLLSYIIIISMGALFLLAIFIMLIGFKKLKREKLEKHRAMETVHQWTKKVIIVKPSLDEVDGSDGLQIPIVRIEKQRTTVHQSQYSNDPSVLNEYEFPLDSNWEFPRNHLKFGPTLGEGAFGRVVMAEAYGLEKPQQSQIVAVKMVKEGHTDADITGLVREMEVMKMIGKHINIINLLGCCSQDGPLYVIVEYAPYGNLKDFLKKNLAMADYNSLNTQHVLTQKELTSFAYQVARGMEYLASRRYIHRDLAARNVLVCDNYIVKIADFGLARDVQESDYYRKCTNGRLPIKWMAPESLRDRFYDSQSDVWSYGILLWEIMTFGDQPYSNILYPSEDLYEYLKSGHRMEKPPRCPINIYALMRQCWNWDPKARPTFTEIVFNLEDILTSSSNEEYLNLINGPYIDDPSDGEDQDVVDGFRGPPVCRPFLRRDFQ